MGCAPSRAGAITRGQAVIDTIRGCTWEDAEELRAAVSERDLSVLTP